MRKPWYFAREFIHSIRTRIRGWRQRLGNLSSISIRVGHFKIPLQSMDKSRVLQDTVHIHPFFHHLRCWRVTYVLIYSTRKKVKFVNSVYWPPVKSFPSTQWGRTNTEKHVQKKLCRFASTVSLGSATWHKVFPSFLLSSFPVRTEVFEEDTYKDQPSIYNNNIHLFVFLLSSFHIGMRQRPMESKSQLGQFSSCVAALWEGTLALATVN